MEIYNVIVTNEEGHICCVKSFKEKSDAIAYLKESHDNDLRVAELEGDAYEIDDFFAVPEVGYTVYYGDFFYHGEIIKSELV